MPRRDCTRRLVHMMAIQHAPPISNVLPPVLTSFTMSVFSPMAAMAVEMRKELIIFNEEKQSFATVKAFPDRMEVVTVVTNDARTKNAMNLGNARLT